MKKVFLSLAAIAIVATGSLTVTSCGGDDSTPGPVVGNGLKLTVETAAGDIVAGEAFQMSIKKADGTPIDGAELYISGEPNTTPILSEDGVFSISGPEGEYLFTAVYDGQTSNEVTVVVNPAEVVPSEGTGSFTFGGVTYESSESYVVFLGLGYTDDTRTTVGAYWTTATLSGAYEADVVFYTPATPTGQGNNYNYEQPAATNTTGVSASVYQDGTQDPIGTTEDSVVMTFNATRNESGKAYVGKYSGVSADINGSPFSAKFEGTSPYVNGSAKSGAKGTASFISAKANTGKISFSNKEIVRFAK